MSERGFSIPPLAYYLARAIDSTFPFWTVAGNLETALLRRRLCRVEIDRPIYVGSMARSGTTILTEMLGSHPEVAHQRYIDFVNVWTPTAWDRTAARLPLDDTPVERLHDDGLTVTPEQPRGGGGGHLDAVLGPARQHYIDKLREPTYYSGWFCHA